MGGGVYILGGQVGNGQVALADGELSSQSTLDSQVDAAQDSAAEAVLSAVGEHLEHLTDEELLDLTRQGHRAAYSVMWTRHAASGLSSARYFGSELDANDLVAEAYSKIFITLTRGGGPKGAFRTYLQVTIRNIANKWRNEQRSLVDLDSSEMNDMLDGVEDGADTRAERSIMQAAFTSLPSSWQEILWYTEVLDLKPQEIATKMGLNPNGISALSFRAREGLRKAWIREHLGKETLPKACADTVDRLPAYILGNQTAQRSRKIAEHLATCERCSRIHSEATSVASRLHTVVLPLMLAGGVGAGILGALGSAPSSASAASLIGAGSAKATAIGGTKVALISGIGALTAGVAIVAVVLSGVGSQPAASSPAPVAVADTQDENVDATKPPSETTEESDALGRDDWTSAPDQAETAALYSVPVVSDVEAPQYSFQENTVFATPSPLLTGYATPGAEVTLFVSAQDSAGGQSYEKLTTEVTAAGSWSVNSASVPDGEYTVRAYQQLGEGARSDTETRSFLVKNGGQLPAPSVANVDNANDRLLPVVTGTGVPGAIVNVLVNGVPNESAVAEDGSWSVTTVRGGIVGANSLTVRQRDRASNAVSVETVPLQFDLVAPDVAVDNSGVDPVLVVSAVPQSAVTVTDGQGFTHRLINTQATNRVRVMDNAGASAEPTTRRLSVVYTADGGKRVGAPLLKQVEL